MTTPQDASGDAQTAHPTWRRHLALALAVLAAPGLALWVHFTVGWRALLTPWTTLDGSDLAVMLLGTLVSYGARAVRLYDYFYPVVANAPLATLRLSLLHNVFNNLLPLRTGEAALPVLMKRYFRHPMTQTASALVWVRLLDLGALVLLASVVVAVAPGALGARWPVLPGLAVFGAVASAGGMVAITWAAGRGVPTEAADGMLGRLAHLARLGLPAGLGRAVRVLAYTALAWGGKGLAFVWLVVSLTGLEAAPAAIGVAAGELSSVLPVHGVAGAGTYEAATVGALVTVGAGHDDALLAAVNVHFFLLGVAVLFGLGALLLPVPRPVSAAADAADAGPIG